MDMQNPDCCIETGGLTLGFGFPVHSSLPLSPKTNNRLFYTVEVSFLVAMVCCVGFGGLGLVRVEHLRS